MAVTPMPCLAHWLPAQPSTCPNTLAGGWAGERAYLRRVSPALRDALRVNVDPDGDTLLLPLAVLCQGNHSGARPCQLQTLALEICSKAWEHQSCDNGSVLGSHLGAPGPLLELSGVRLVTSALSGVPGHTQRQGRGGRLSSL